MITRMKKFVIFLFLSLSSFSLHGNNFLFSGYPLELGKNQPFISQRYEFRLPLQIEYILGTNFTISSILSPSIGKSSGELWLAYSFGITWYDDEDLNSLFFSLYPVYEYLVIRDLEYPAFWNFCFDFGYQFILFEKFSIAPYLRFAIYQIPTFIPWLPDAGIKVGIIL